MIRVSCKSLMELWLLLSAFNNSAPFCPSGRARYEAFNNSCFISSSVRVSSGHGTSIRSSDISLISSSTLARVVDGVVQLYIISVRSSTTLSSLSSKSSSGYNGFLSINFFDFFECVVLNAHWRFRHE